MPYKVIAEKNGEKRILAVRKKKTGAKAFKSAINSIGIKSKSVKIKRTR